MNCFESIGFLAGLSFVNINPSNLSTWVIFSLSFIFKFFLQCFKVFSIQVFHSFVWSYQKICFEGTEMGTIS